MNISTLPSTTDDVILDRFSPAELFKYSRTCSVIHETVNSYIRRKFRLHSLLERYFSPAEIPDFRRLQYNTGMLISGSTALQFFDRTMYPDSDLDLYVYDRQRKAVALWLLQVGYEYVPYHDWDPPTLHEALVDYFHLAAENPEVKVSTNDFEYDNPPMVLTFEKRAPNRKVQVITSMGNPVANVLRFHSTCVMNIITHNKAYSFFPRATFEDHRRSLKVIPRGFEQYTERALAKYEARGWEIIDEATRDDFDGPNAVFPYGPRRVGDSRCWTMRIWPDIDLPDGSVENNAWETIYTSVMRVRMGFYNVHPHIYRMAKYIIPPDDRLLHWIVEITQQDTSKRSPSMNKLYDQSYGSLIRWYFDMYS